MTPSNLALPTAEQKREWRELAEKATSGPWQARFLYRSQQLVRKYCKAEKLLLGTPESQDWPDAEFQAASRTAVPALLDENTALEEKVRKLEGELAEARKVYRCFHCGFETVDAKEAAGHFGDRDDMAPLCLDWSELDADGRASEYQNVCGSLNCEREENCTLRTKIEGLEYQVEGQRSEIHSFKPFRECDTIHQVFNVYDSMEGRALLAEGQRDSAREQRDRLATALRLIASYETYLELIVPDTDQALGNGEEAIRYARSALAELEGRDERS